jgi:hypothetical protein
VIAWWDERRWRSWDGRGGILWTSVRVNKREDGRPQMNAWGGGGGIQIGDGFQRGTDGNDYTLAASRDVVGHEFMHSVIDATSRLAYRDESGAINEALSDFFGAALDAPGDRFASLEIGALGGHRGFRHLLEPRLFEQPEKYSDYLVTTGDSGGVHTNSGILNKAHALVVEGGEFRSARVEAQGVSRAETILRLTNQLVRMDPESTMEEFAAHVVAYCDLHVALRRLFSTPGPDFAPTCEAFGRAYLATEVGRPTAVPSDLALTGIRMDRGQTRLEFRNIGPGPIDLGGYGPTLFAILDNVSIPSPTTSISDPAGYAAPFVGPGGAGFFRFRMPEILAGFDTRTEQVPVVLAIEPYDGTLDLDRSNNWRRFTVGPDYVSWGGLWTDRPAQQDSLYEAVGANRSTRGRTDGVVGVILVRTTSHGVFEVADGSERVSTGSTTYSDWRSAGIEIPYGNDPPAPPPPVIVSTWELDPSDPDRRRRQFWMDANGGLAELEGQVALFHLVDATDVVDEIDETNNLYCLNCRTPASDQRGMTVRLRSVTDVDPLFPETYRAAARKLRSDPPRTFFPVFRFIPGLRYFVTPSFP